MRYERAETRERDAGILQYFEECDRRIGPRSSIAGHFLSSRPASTGRACAQVDSRRARKPASAGGRFFHFEDASSRAAVAAERSPVATSRGTRRK